MRNIQDSNEEAKAASYSLKERENYWLGNLSGIQQKSIFPYDFQKTAASQKNIKAEEFEITGKLYARLIEMSNGSDTRLHMILVTAVIILLNQYTGGTDIILGTTITRQELEGEFVNTILPLRNRINRGMTFKQLLLQVRETVAKAVTNQNYPVTSLINRLEMTYSEDEFPLFDIAVLLENIHDKKYLQEVPVSLTFHFIRTGETIKGQLEYDALLYEKSTLETIITYFTRILQKTLFDVNLLLSHLDIITARERKEILYDINDTAAEYPKNKRIHRLFESRAEKSPRKIAVVEAGNNCSISYKELNRRANQVARLLMDRGVEQDVIVGVLQERSIEMMVGIWGILKAGGAYLPIDPDLPAHRIKFMLKDSGADPVLTGKKIVETGDYEGYMEKSLLLDQKEIYRGKTGNPVTAGGVDNLAYLIYTSGTTGKPKGILIHHRGLVNYVSWACKRYIKGEPVNFPLYTSISFDMTVTSIYAPLISGNTVILYGKDPNEFLIEKVVRENKSQVVKLTPSHLKLIRKRRDLAENSRIKRFIVGGEEFAGQLAREIHDTFNGKIELYNEYGPTEAVVGCMIYRFKPDENKRKSVSIGSPADNVRIYLLSGNQKPVPKGAVGEIYIAGDGIARGYLNSIELTVEKFIPNPFIPGPPGGDKWMYKTGDLARCLPGGGWEFLGRIDEQVNIKGIRIELPEIESHLLKHPQIKDAVVIAGDDGHGNQHLCAYVVTDDAAQAGPGAREIPDHCEIGDLKVSDLKAYLSRYLPVYMIPSYFVHMKEMPLTANGKLNRKALPEPLESMDTGTQYVEPRNEIEKKLAAIWAGELELKKVGIKDNFFNIGGDSIKSISLLSSINKEFKIQFELADIYDNETIEKIAGKIQENDIMDVSASYQSSAQKMEEIKNKFMREK